MSIWISLKMAEQSEAKRAKRSFASKYFKIWLLTRSFASRFLLRFAQPFLAKFKWTINWSLSPQGLKPAKRFSSMISKINPISKTPSFVQFFDSKIASVVFSDYRPVQNLSQIFVCEHFFISLKIAEKKWKKSQTFNFKIIQFDHSVSVSNAFCESRRLFLNSSDEKRTIFGSLWTQF